jgi:transcriptional regulator GlxA family with amidase domain
MAKELAALTVGILLFNDVEVLDFAGPFEVFSVAKEVGKHREGKQLFNVATIAEKRNLITATGGLQIKPHATIDNHPPLDILIIPGGWGTRRERKNKKLLDWITEQDKRTTITASVCTGAFLLAETNLLAGKQVTTHWNSIEWMKQNYPNIQIIATKRIVDEGHIITSAGVSAGIDMSMHIVERIYGKDIAQWTAKRMEYTAIK